MNALLHLTALSLRLNFRNRMAILYGYLFPLIFLIAFWAIYRSEPVPLILHLGQFLTITILGGACFGLPTTIVAERERGVWRRYRLLPARGFVFVTSVLLARVVLLASAAALQLALAFLLRMPLPGHPALLLLAFAAAMAAFMCFGLVIAMLVDNVAAVQALGQCLFLPMLIIGGVAVRLESLPVWAQHVSAFFPGRYAVDAIQSAATGTGDIGFDLAALGAIALAAAIAAGAMFRWDKALAPRRGWLVVALGMWIAVGIVSEVRSSAEVSVVKDTNAVGVPHDYVTAAPLPVQVTPPSEAPPPKDLQPPTWRDVTDADIAGIAFDRLPADSGIVAPVARPDEEPDAVLKPQLDRIQAALPGWAPGDVGDPVQQVRNLLTVAAVPDLLQMAEVERFVPRLVFARLQAVIPPRDLPRILYWVAMHPGQGSDSAIHALAPFGLPDITGSPKAVRDRVMLYAFKLLGRLTGHITATEQR